MITISAAFLSKEIIATNTTAVQFHLNESFSFSPGHYVTITISQLSHLPMREQFRDFSITSSPDELPILTITFRNSDSAFKRALLSMSEGQLVSVQGNKGLFTLPDSIDGKKLCFIAGGVGITPFISMIRYMSHHNVPVKPVVFYFNRDRESAPYLSELEGYGSQITLVNTFGLLDERPFVAHTAETDGALWYIAGPPGMVMAAREVLAKQNVDESHIKTEEFTGYE